jgi:hypothetical protein
MREAFLSEINYRWRVNPPHQRPDRKVRATGIRTAALINHEAFLTENRKPKTENRL